MNIKENFVRPDDPVLVKVAEEVPVDQITSAETKETIEKMLRTAYGEQTERDKPLLVGLAAPQIGISKRIILVDVAADGKGQVGNLQIFINPEITQYSDDQSEWYEGCYSTDHVCGIVSRPNKISVRAFDENGKNIEADCNGYTARIVQHEIDHLNGKEFVTHITDDDKLHWVEDDQFPEYRNNQAWRNWPQKCPRDKWEKIKGIQK